MLSEQQYNFFQEQGYLVVDNVLDDSILEPIRQDYSALIDRLVERWVAEGKMPPPSAGDDFYDKLLQAYENKCEWWQPLDISLPRADKTTEDTPMHFSEPIFNMLTAPKLLDIMEQLIGGEITSNPIQHTRLKPPKKQLRADQKDAHVGATEFHQDRGVAHAEADETSMVTCWIAVGDATEENGCLQVIPRKPSTELMPHCPMNNQLAIANDYLDYASAVPLPVKAGGIILFHPLTPHASLENNSDRFRWSFDVRFNRTGEPTGRSHFPSFVARSRSNPEQELKDWRVWKGNWEQARSNLAKNKEHIVAHRWDASAAPCA